MAILTKLRHAQIFISSFYDWVNLVITLSQSSPFPEGDYALLYTVNDGPSGNTFEVAKDITIADSEGDDLVG